MAPADRFEAYAAADVALAASGTVGLELALARLPCVVFYRTSPITAAIARRLIRVAHVSLINLVADSSVVPELIQEHATPHRLAEEANALLESPVRWRAQVEGLDAVARALGADDVVPSRRAGAAIAALLEKRPATA